MESDCSVCCEPSNKTKRRLISCFFCSYSSCASCIKNYLLDSFHLPHCMNCRKEWSATFLATHLSGFMKSEYRKKRELLLLEREKALLPSLLGEAERMKRIKYVNQFIEQTQNELCLLYQHPPSVPLDYRMEKRELKRTIRSLYEDRDKLYVHPIERKSFFMKCTVSDCRGFLTTRYKCGLNGHLICPTCHTEIQNEHVCNPDTIATIQELKKSTKSCPSCHCPIYKTEGCDQMWCIQCHTAFSWKTGLIEKGIIHNPHYFEFMKERGNAIRNPMDIICGGLPDYLAIYDYIITNQVGQDEISYLRLLFESLAHLRGHVLMILPNPQEQINHQDILLSYLIEEYTESQLKATLYVREQKRNRGLEERQVVEAYVTIGEEAFRKLLQFHITIFEFIHEMEEMKQYSKIELEKMNHRYSHTGFITPMMIR